MCMHLHDIQEEGGGSFFQIVSTGLSALTLSTFIHGDPLPTPKTSSNRYFHSSFFSCKIIASREGFLAMQGINTFFCHTVCNIFFMSRLSRDRICDIISLLGVSDFLSLLIRIPISCSFILPGTG